MISLDRAREHYASAKYGLIIAEQTGDPDRIRIAQESLERAEKVLIAAELEDAGGWWPGKKTP